MPRKGRLKIVGKAESWAAEVRLKEMRALLRELRRAWRERPTS